MAFLEKHLFEANQAARKIEQELELLSKTKSQINALEKSFEDLKKTWYATYGAQWEKMLSQTKNEYRNLEVLEDTAVKMDISYRHELFWYCYHLREWEYIQELKEVEVKNKERGKISYEKKLRRISKVTPLMVATFHTVPKFATFFSNSDGEAYYSGLFDLMIVDEAGQVSPEIAVPSLSLTKKILAVGDCQQIEPVWNISSVVDYANATKFQVINDEKEYNWLSRNGYTAASGVLMELIKQTTPFNYRHKNGTIEKGAYLLEHRRCLDPIISYSKEYVYNGSLRLMVGSDHGKSHQLPPLGYIHVDGISEKHNGSSRKNIKEAKAIIQWILNQKKH